MVSSSFALTKDSCLMEIQSTNKFRIHINTTTFWLLAFPSDSFCIQDEEKCTSFNMFKKGLTNKCFHLNI
jgi:hypothetical protein